MSVTLTVDQHMAVKLILAVVVNRRKSRQSLAMRKKFDLDLVDQTDVWLRHKVCAIDEAVPETVK